MVMAAIGSVLPWITGLYGSLDIGGGGGLDKDGMITIVMAVAAGVFFLVGVIGKARWPFVVGLIISILTLAVFTIDLFDVVNTLSVSNVGYGLWVGTAGAALGLVAGIGGIAARRDQAAS